ncbi:MAG: outer membrane beta-barrel protein [Bdellovibrionota bacterium]
MKKTDTRGAGILGVLLGALFLLPAAAFAQGREGPLRFGLRGGLVFATQDFQEPGIELSSGPVVSAIATYATSEEVHIGGILAWTHQDIEATGARRGTIDPLTLLAQFEYHGGGSGPTSPYFLLGAGIHVNLASYTSQVESTLGKLETDPSFALRVGAGIDHWFSPEIAVNAEAGWTLNRGTAKDGAGEFDFDASTLGILLGLRFKP